VAQHSYIVQLNDQLDIDGGKGGSEVRKYKTFYLWLEFNIFYETQPLGVPGQPLKVSKRRVLPPIPQGSRRGEAGSVCLGQESTEGWTGAVPELWAPVSDTAVQKEIDTKQTEASANPLYDRMYQIDD